MIPEFNKNGVLPTESGGHALYDHSPFEASIVELTDRFGYSPDRRQLIRQLIMYRSALYDLGLVDGYQLIGGSFVTDCEKLRGRPPRDLDIISILLPSRELRAKGESRSKAVAHVNERLIGPEAKRRYGIDAYVAAFGWQPIGDFMRRTLKMTIFFTIKPESAAKGTIIVPLSVDDDRLLGQRLTE